MPVFRYQAADKLGRTVKGQMVAQDESMLESRLRTAGLWLIDLTREQSVGPTSRRAEPDLGRMAMSAKQKRRSLIEFCTVMSFQCGVGIPLMQGLDVAFQDCDNPAFRRILGGLQYYIESGSLFHEALERYPRMFSPHFICVMKAGEVSGNLPLTFDNLCKYLEWVEQVIADVRAASLYPLITMVVIFAFVLFLFTFIIPKFAALLTGLHLALPLITQIIFGLGDFAKQTWWIGVLGMLFLVVGLPLGRRYSRRIAWWVDNGKLRMPVFGELNLMLAISRFTHNLSLLYRSGIPILQAMGFCQGLIGNAVVEDAVGEVIEDVKTGSTISEAMRRHAVFPPLLLRMVIVGETTGSLDNTLEKLSDFYNQVIPRRIKKIFTIVEPALMLFLIFVVGAVALSIYLPLLQLMGSIK